MNSARDYVTPPDSFILRASDRLYDECLRAIREGRIGSRSPIGDATLDYRDIRFPHGDPDDSL